MIYWGRLLTFLNGKKKWLTQGPIHNGFHPGRCLFIQMTFVCLALASNSPKSTTWQRQTPPSRLVASPLERKYSWGYVSVEFLTIEFWTAAPSERLSCVDTETLSGLLVLPHVFWWSTATRPVNLILCILSFRTLGIPFANTAAHPANSRLAGGGAGFLGC